MKTIISSTYFDTSVANAIFKRSLFFSFLIICTLIAVIFSADRYFSLNNKKASELTLVTSVKNDILHDLLLPLPVLLILRNNTSLFSDTPESNKNLTQHFIISAQTNTYFYQLRFIDLKGHEIVRVENINSKPVPIAEEKLQNKFSRYYVTEGLKIARDQVYISPMDLNVEHGHIEKPFRPVIRFVLAAFSPKGEKTGILVANIDMKYLLERLNTFQSRSNSQLMILDHEGYWLYSKEKSLRWGNQLATGESFPLYYNSQIWQAILSRKVGQHISKKGLFTFHQAEPKYSSNVFQTSGIQLDLINPPQWYVVSHMDSTQLSEIYLKRFYFYSIILVLIFFLSIPLLKRVASQRASSLYAQRRIEAYTRIIEESEELIYIVSADGKILFANKAVEECYGYRPEEFIGKRPNIFKSGHHPKEFYSLLWKTIKSGEQFQGIFVNRKKDGSLFHEAKKIIPLNVNPGEEPVYVSLGRNLTSTFKSKLHNIEMTDRLSAGIQHHFNNILCGIKGYIDLAIERIDSKPDDTTKDLLNLSLESAVKAEEIIAKISKISRLSLKEKTKTDLMKIISATVEDARKELPANISLTFTVNVSDCLVSCDTELIITAVKALITNAIEAVETEGDINIAIDEFFPVDEICFNCHQPVNGKQLMISVQDNGMGIAAEKIEDVFDPFYSTKDSALLVGKTLGLGLTIVRSIIHLHEGHIFIESSPNNGTSISLLLPLNIDDEHIDKDK